MIQLNELMKCNERLFEKALMLDNQKWGLEKRFSNIFEIKYTVSLKTSKNYLIIYQGEIEITKMICELAIKNKANVVFILNDEYLATNKLIVRLANEVIKQQKLKIIIKIYNNIDNNKIFKSSEKMDETIFFGSYFDFTDIKNNIRCSCQFIETEI